MKKVSIFATALAISVLFLASFAYAAPSKVIPIQGKLTQPSGVPYNGQYSMTFKIFDVATSGTLLYTETLSNIPVSAGLFSIVLGENPSNPLTPAFDKDYYIEITIGSETLQPRQRLLSAPYSLYSQNSSYAQNSNYSTYAQNSSYSTNSLNSQNAVTATNIVGGNVNATSGTFTNSGYALNVNGSSKFVNGQLRAESGALVQGGALWISPPNFIYTNTINAADGDGLKIADNTNSGGLFIKGNSGNIGIGTTTPSEKLDVVGNVKASGNINATRIQAYSGTNPNLQGQNYNIAGGSIGGETLYAYNSICVGNTNGQCTGTGGTVITPSNISTSQICIGSDCRTSWPATLSGDVQFNSVNIITNLKVSGSANIASDLIIGLISPTLNQPISYASASGTLSNIGATYCYKITAYNGAGESKTSVEKCIAPGAGHNTINLSWTPVEFATGYKVYGRTSTTYGLIGTVTDTKFTDLGTIAPGAQPSSSATVGNIKATGGATFGGNVGIGTTTPQATLDVNGAVRFGSSGGLLYTNSPGNFGGKETVLTVNDGQGTNQDEIWIGPNTATGDKGYIQLRANKTYIHGNVGIGTTTPTGKLDVSTSTLLYGPDITLTSNTISGGILQSGFPAANAFDKNQFTLLSVTSSTSTWIGQDFNGQKNIRKIRVFRGTVGSYGFNAKLQYSDDSTTWYDTNVNMTISLNIGWSEFLVNNYGAHRYWRLLDIGGSSYFQTEEIEMMEATNSALLVKDDGNVTINGKLNWPSRPWFVAAGDSTQNWISAAAATWTKIKLNDKRGTAASSYNSNTGDFTAPEDGVYSCYIHLYQNTGVWSNGEYRHIISTCINQTGTEYVCNNFYTWDYSLDQQSPYNGAPYGIVTYGSTPRNEGIFMLKKGENLYWREYVSLATSYLYYPAYSRMGCFEL